jgi:FKBP-type peptidyl-prolyl cis-trans isomerase 2
MTLQKNDFIEIEFTGKTKEGEIFDSNIKSDLEKAKLKMDSKPLVFCLGSGMFLKGVDEFLVGKKIGEYEIQLSPENAFGKRDAGLIQMAPIKIFHEQKVNPVPGAMFNFDGRIAKILTVSGGRVMIDFNNPLAGKDVSYKVKVLRKIENTDDKVNALNDFLFRKKFDFEIKDNTIKMSVEKPFVQFVEIFKDKFKEFIGMDLEVKEKQKEKKDITPQ